MNGSRLPITSFPQPLTPSLQDENRWKHQLELPVLLSCLRSQDLSATTITATVDGDSTNMFHRCHQKIGRRLKHLRICIERREQSSYEDPPNRDEGAKCGVSEGIRTPDNWSHNPGLYQLSYAHHKLVCRRNRPAPLT
jgi:hypothetical protein